VPRVAIHQPNFFPWLGYFDKIAKADVFVVLDDGQMSKTGGTWINRVPILVNGARAWLTVPIVRSYHGTRQVREIAIDASKPWQKKVLDTNRMNYARTPCFAEVFPTIVDLVDSAGDSLCGFNLDAIRALCAKLGLDAGKLRLASTVSVEGSGTSRLIALVRAVGGTTYVSGGGAGGYQEDERYAAAGVELVFQAFEHPVYPQRGTGAFVPGLSLIDAAMNCGWSATAALMSR